MDLTAFYNGLAEEYHWSEDPETSEEGDLLMSTVEGEMLESYYPGLGDIATKQLVAKMPMMSSVVNEIVLVQCESEEDATEVASFCSPGWTARPKAARGIPSPWRPGARAA